jgi:D-glycero-alpha-D-manno-heptose-7-phosphate kinase
VRIDSSAPTRIDLAGGTLDIWPLYLFHDGAQTLNAAIDLRAHCTLVTRGDHKIVVRSEDTGREIEAGHWSELKENGELKLLGRILHFFEADGIELTTRCESPVGAGIAGSSALNIAVCGALSRWRGQDLAPDTLLDIAKNVEAQAIDVPTGVQDYRPALYGGVAAVELRVDGVRRVPLRVDPADIEARFVLAYTGASRNSGINNWEITKRHIDGDRKIHGHFERIRDIAVAMREALEARAWDEVGRQVAAEWDNRKALAPGVSTPLIEDLMARARAAGATATKICGAGGGGCFICYGDPARTPAVRQALADGGARVLDYRVERDGLRVEQLVADHAWDTASSCRAPR